MNSFYPFKWLVLSAMFFTIFFSGCSSRNRNKSLTEPEVEIDSAILWYEKYKEWWVFSPDYIDYLKYCVKDCGHVYARICIKDSVKLDRISYAISKLVPVDTTYFRETHPFYVSQVMLVFQKGSIDTISVEWFPGRVQINDDDNYNRFRKDSLIWQAVRDFILENDPEWLDNYYGFNYNKQTSLRSRN